MEVVTGDMFTSLINLLKELWLNRRLRQLRCSGRLEDLFRGGLFTGGGERGERERARVCPKV